MRASDADREQITERLRAAATEGRLLAHELEERIARALRARTYGELEAIVADLPAASPARRGRRLPVHPAVAALIALIAFPFVLCGVLLALCVAMVMVWGVASLWFVWLAMGIVLFLRGRGHHRRVGHLGPPFGPRRMQRGGWPGGWGPGSWY